METRNGPRVSGQLSSKVALSPERKERKKQTSAWTTGITLACWTPRLHRCPLPLSVYCASRILELFSDCFAVCTVKGSNRHEEVGHQYPVLMNLCYRARKKKKSKRMHTDELECTQLHSDMLLYICTVYTQCIVPDSVLCMLTCRWNMNIIYRTIVQVGLVSGLTFSNNASHGQLYRLTLYFQKVMDWMTEVFLFFFLNPL